MIDTGAFLILMLAGQVLVVLYQIEVYGPTWATWWSLGFLALSVFNVALYVGR